MAAAADLEEVDEERSEEQEAPRKDELLQETTCCLLQRDPRGGARSPHRIAHPGAVDATTAIYASYIRTSTSDVLRYRTTRGTAVVYFPDTNFSTVYVDIVYILVHSSTYAKFRI